MSTSTRPQSGANFTVGQQDLDRATARNNLTAATREFNRAVAAARAVGYEVRLVEYGPDRKPPGTDYSKYQATGLTVPVLHLALNLAHDSLPVETFDPAKE